MIEEGPGSDLDPDPYCLETYWYSGALIPTNNYRII